MSRLGGRPIRYFMCFYGNCYAIPPHTHKRGGFLALFYVKRFVRALHQKKTKIVGTKTVPTINIIHRTLRPLQLESR